MERMILKGSSRSTPDFLISFWFVPYYNVRIFAYGVRCIDISINGVV